MNIPFFKFAMNAVDRLPEEGREGRGEERMDLVLQGNRQCQRLKAEQKTDRVVGRIEGKERKDD